MDSPGDSIDSSGDYRFIRGLYGFITRSLFLTDHLKRAAYEQFYTGNYIDSPGDSIDSSGDYRFTRGLY